MEFGFETPLWLAKAEAAWVFASLPAEHADEIEERASSGPGFGSIRVVATIGGTTWETSIFPDKSSATYVLPVKKQVRVAEDLAVGDVVSIHLRIEVG